MTALKKIWIILLQIWAFLDGKKTVIGGMFCFASVFITEVIVGIWGVHAGWLPPLVKTLNWIGMPLMGIGGVHKGVKMEKEKKQAQALKVEE